MESGIAGAIVGRSLYTGAVDLALALAVAARARTGTEGAASCC